ncbi:MULTISPECIES: hypothetical protein [Dickeya]|uniref:hypothetical protein n=1 Tax=Dickeya TaxID=204037 RepID=UPI00037371EA|nr:MULTISPECIES: hypothetical protein [Dickeya]AJC68420.1 hypothetical protein W909_10475 [Dickeya zeae EC1]
MHQEFNGTASGQFSARDIINIHHPNEPVAEDEQLLPAQRQRLHQLLDEISAISGEAKKDLWRAVHAHIDVRSVHFITTQKFHKAEIYLEKRLADAKLARECKRLVAEILRLTAANKSAERDRFCLRTFGTKMLNDLSREQLQAVFNFFDNEPASRSRESELKKNAHWQDIVIAYPKLFLVFFLAGFVVSFVFR